MAEPVNINGQVFIKTEAGWVDQKTKQPAPEGLLKLLDSLDTGEVEKKTRTRIDRSKGSAVLGDTKYVFDSNSQSWIDEKTKLPAPVAFQKALTASTIVQKTEQFNEQKIKEAESKLAYVEEEVKAAVMGGVGMARNVPVRKPSKPTVSGKGQIPIKAMQQFNAPIVQMINHLASIDSFLKQKLDNATTIHNNEIMSEREAELEATKQPDAVKVIEEKKEEESGYAGILLAGGLALLAVPEVRDALGKVIDFAKSAGSFIMKAVTSINGAFKTINSFFGNESAATNTTPNNTEQPPTPDATPEQPQQPTPDATPAPTAPSASSEEGPSLVSSMTTGAVLGGAVASVVPGIGTITGAALGAIGGAVTHFMGGSASTSTPAATGGATTSPTPAADTTAAKVDKPDGSNYDGLRLKSNEAIAGGQAGKETIEFAKVVQSQIPELNRFTAFSDSFHKGRRSKHNTGHAFDFSISDPSKSSEVAQKVKALADANGYKVKIIDEYKNPSSGATGGHIHVTVQGPGNGSTIEGGGSGSGATGSDSSLSSQIGTGVEDALKIIGTIVGKALGPTSYSLRSINTPLPDLSEHINKSAIQHNTIIAENNTKPIPKQDPMAALPNIAGPDTATIQNPPSSEDAVGVEYFLQRFGFYQDSNNNPLKA